MLARSSGGELEQLAEGAPPARERRPGAPVRPNSGRTISGRPTSSLATTGTSIARASLTTTGMESRSPSCGDDAGHREHGRPLEPVAHLGRARSGPAARRGPRPRAARLVLELGLAAGPRPRITTRSSTSASARLGRRPHEVREALLLDQPAHRQHQSLRRVGRAAPEALGVDAHDDPVHPSGAVGPGDPAQVGHRVVAPRGDDVGAADLLLEVPGHLVDVVCVRRQAEVAAPRRAWPSGR